jgi:hypothetical protein
LLVNAENKKLLLVSALKRKKIEISKFMPKKVLLACIEKYLLSVTNDTNVNGIDQGLELRLAVGVLINLSAEDGESTVLQQIVLEGGLIHETSSGWVTKASQYDDKLGRVLVPAKVGVLGGINDSIQNSTVGQNGVVALSVSVGNCVDSSLQVSSVRHVVGQSGASHVATNRLVEGSEAQLESRPVSDQEVVQGLNSVRDRGNVVRIDTRANVLKDHNLTYGGSREGDSLSVSVGCRREIKAGANWEDTSIRL